MATIEQQIGELEGARELMIRYCEYKLRLRDWHGLSDAANDLREIEAELKVLHEWYAQLVRSPKEAGSC